MIELNPEIDFAYYLRALAYLKLNHPEPTATDFQKAISIAEATYTDNPNDYENTFNLAIYHLAANHTAASQTLYEQHLNARSNGSKWRSMTSTISSPSSPTTPKPNRSNNCSKRRPISSSIDSE